MNPDDFVQTVYLGDRACKAILIDCWKKRVAVQIDTISRLRPGTKTWDFYTGADIADGWIVFRDVRGIRFDPAGPIPNDFVNDFAVAAVQSGNGEPAYSFELSIGSVNEAGETFEVRLCIEALGVHLEDPARPGVEITG